MQPSEVISVSTLRAELAHYLSQVSSGKTPVTLVGPHRKPVAALVNLDLLSSSGVVPSMELIHAKAETLWRIASSYQISKIGIFGSVARGEATTTSDIDVAISADVPLTLLDMTSFAVDVENLFGFKVQVVTIDSLSSDLHSEALEDMVFLERFRPSN
jgi:uncharacterized protein